MRRENLQGRGFFYSRTCPSVCLMLCLFLSSGSVSFCSVAARCFNSMSMCRFPVALPCCLPFYLAGSASSLLSSLFLQGSAVSTYLVVVPLLTTFSIGKSLAVAHRS